MASQKVVKLEEVEGQGADQISSPHQTLKFLGSSKPPSFNGEEELKINASLGSAGSNYEERSQRALPEEENVAKDEEEAIDKVYPLPENWPKIPQINRPRSCELSHCRTPCVKKAISHIELIQNIIDEWFKRATQDLKSCASSRHSSPKVLKKQLRFQENIFEHDTSARYSARSYKGSSASRVSSSRITSATTTMSVTGHGVHVEEEEDDIHTDDLPYLGAQDVIDEVITLLAQLENDRQMTYESYLQEIARANKLIEKIDELQLRKLREMPALVQREHEACIVDLNELHWHVSYTKRLEAKAENRFTIAQRLNQQLKEDIGFVKQHVPLVQEKLILEVEAMDKIRKAQGDTDQELVMTKQRQAKTEMKSTEALNKAETERGHIKKELDSVRDDLTSISDELTEAKMTFNAFVHQVNDIYNQLTDNEQELKVLRVKNENARAAEEMQAIKVRDLQSKIMEAEFEHRRLENENEQMDMELNKNKMQHSRRLKELESQMKVLEGKYRTVSRKNQELEMEIEDCVEKIKKCDKQHTADEKNIARINREIERTSTMLHQTMDEHHRISTINHHTRDQLQSLQDKAYRTEETLKTTAETLRRQVKDEIHSRAVLQARIGSDATEIEKTKSESAKKKSKAKSVADEVEQAVSGVLDKVEKLRSVKEERKKRKDELMTQLEETTKQLNESTQMFNNTLTNIEPYHDSLKKNLDDLLEQLKNMEWRSNMMNNKIEEMDAAQGMMERSVKNSEKAIAELTAELEELTIQIDAGKKIEEDLRKQYNATLERFRGNDSKHTSLLKERQGVLKKHELDKERLKEKNKELASRYRQLQNDYVICKEQMLRSYDERVKIEATITDVKQLKSLQTKLHGALAEYFKLSGLYNEAELSKLEQESSINGVRVSELQVGMETALDDISSFLSSQMDGTVARKMAWDAVKRKSVIDVDGPGLALPPVIAGGAPPLSHSQIGTGTSPSRMDSRQRTTVS
ncbi:coiled-coil domain-containing protein 178-like isoform x2 [Plakobranchus ocellatus]|uniref:Coiled-coil domain-containing protein 178-like isoform x2 n=1 Tax=Plakobranchus ocellatus TaxID=259542 RepID=A0AAV4B2T7_9GAST|nr:coiled-coil domain-containing protein 178-like isoform x2 [Plakobranchus ocellatus]